MRMSRASSRTVDCMPISPVRPGFIRARMAEGYVAVGVAIRCHADARSTPRIRRPSGGPGGLAIDESESVTGREPTTGDDGTRHRG